MGIFSKRPTAPNTVISRIMQNTGLNQEQANKAYENAKVAILRTNPNLDGEQLDKTIVSWFPQQNPTGPVERSGEAPAAMSNIATAATAAQIQAPTVAAPLNTHVAAPAASAAVSLDSLSFGEAFRKAMKQYGAGNNFTWRGKQYALAVAPKSAPKAEAPATPVAGRAVEVAPVGPEKPAVKSAGKHYSTNGLFVPELDNVAYTAAPTVKADEAASKIAGASTSPAASGAVYAAPEAMAASKVSYVAPVASREAQSAPHYSVTGLYVPEAEEVAYTAGSPFANVKPDWTNVRLRKNGGTMPLTIRKK